MIKSPIYYTGNKFKLLPQILPLFPKNIQTFIDVFGGSGTILLNIEADKYIYNELNPYVCELFSLIQQPDIGELIIQQTKKWNLSSTNKIAFLNARSEYNKNQTAIGLLTLICHSFSNQMRFNKKNEFNIPFGERTVTKDFFKNCEDAQLFFKENKNIQIYNLSFEKVPIYKESFLYLDPPYFGSIATYNESGGWSIREEEKLRDFLLKQNTPFALSNELIKNSTLREWAEDNHLNIYGLNFSYSHCNYHRKEKGTEEVLITNYT